MNNSVSLAKVWFVLSIAVLSFLYGAAVGKWEWFPYSFLERATNQARVVQSWWAADSSDAFLVDQVYKREGVRAPDPEGMQPGMTLISSLWRRADGWTAIKMLDEKGTFLHAWNFDWEDVFPGDIAQRHTLRDGNLHGVHLLPNGDMLVNHQYVGMARLDACGDVRWSMKEGNHHSIHRAEDGSFWVPGVSPEPRATSERYPDGFPGLGGKSVWVDRILRVSEEGEIQEDMNVLGILYENGLERYIPKVLGGHRPTPETVPTDLTHLNDIEPLGSSMADEYPLFEAGDVLVSLRQLSLVFVFDPESRTVKWHASDPFIYQHDPDFVGGGWIGVFDNNYDLTDRGQMLGGSRIVFLQPHSDSIDVRFPTQQSEPFYTSVTGRWQQLENGNMLLAESRAGRAVEVDSTGRTVWEWVHPAYNSKIPAVTDASRHDLTRSDIADWSCSAVESSGSRSSSSAEAR